MGETPHDAGEPTPVAWRQIKTKEEARQMPKVSKDERREPRITAR